MLEKLSSNTRLLIASVISALIIFAWQSVYVKPMLEEQRTQDLPTHKAKVAAPEEIHVIKTRDEIIAQGFHDGHRIKISTPKLTGSINLDGARIDDIILNNYNTEANKESPHVILFSPSKTNDVYFAEFGWIKKDTDEVIVPDNKTIWKANKTELTPNEPVELSWQNPQGLVFIINLTVDENYLFKVEQKVLNHSTTAVELSSYSLINRLGVINPDANTISHEGPIAVVDSLLMEIDYNKVKENEPDRFFEGNINWVGFSDKYWLSALVPQESIKKSEFSHFINNKTDRFQVSYTTAPFKVEPKGEHLSHNLLFAGAKELALLDNYAQQYKIPFFDRAVDFGMLYFITKPIFLLLSFFYEGIGNFGIAILILTVVIKTALFPIAHKGFTAMNKIKVLQPKMQQLKERYKESPQEFQKNLMELYRKEKANPLSGCLPMILQIPIFFALYKVLYVSIEMRHAPFFLWIHDLSAPDPTNIFTLFGLLPWSPPSLLHVGIFPLFMAFTMFIQQKLGPEPTDATQAQVMKFMPWIFLFMFASFPSGLVIYWAWSNILSIFQQSVMKKIET